MGIQNKTAANPGLLLSPEQLTAPLDSIDHDTQCTPSGFTGRFLFLNRRFYWHHLTSTLLLFVASLHPWYWRGSMKPGVQCTKLPRWSDAFPSTTRSTPSARLAAGGGALPHISMGPASRLKLPWDMFSTSWYINGLLPQTGFTMFYRFTWDGLLLRLTSSCFCPCRVGCLWLILVAWSFQWWPWLLVFPFFRLSPLVLAFVACMCRYVVLVLSRAVLGFCWRFLKLAWFTYEAREPCHWISLNCRCRRFETRISAHELLIHQELVVIQNSHTFRGHGFRPIVKWKPWETMILVGTLEPARQFTCGWLPLWNEVPCMGVVVVCYSHVYWRILFCVVLFAKLRSPQMASLSPRYKESVGPGAKDGEKDGGIDIDGLAAESAYNLTEGVLRLKTRFAFGNGWTMEGWHYMKDCSPWFSDTWTLGAG